MRDKFTKERLKNSLLLDLQKKQDEKTIDFDGLHQLIEIFKKSENYNPVKI